MGGWTVVGTGGPIELVGPHGYVHGWIFVGGGVTHKDGSKGTVLKYAKETQTAHVQWHSGLRSTKNDGLGTTKAYHLVQSGGTGKSEPTTPRPPGTKVIGRHQVAADDIISIGSVGPFRVEAINRGSVSTQYVGRDLKTGERVSKTTTNDTKVLRHPEPPRSDTPKTEAPRPKPEKIAPATGGSKNVHAWAAHARQVRHRDGSIGNVTRYDPATQTIHANWISGPRAGTVRTTKAYHVKPIGGIQAPKSEFATSATAQKGDRVNHAVHGPATVIGTSQFHDYESVHLRVDATGKTASYHRPLPKSETPVAVLPKKMEVPSDLAAQQAKARAMSDLELLRAHHQERNPDSALIQTLELKKRSLVVQAQANKYLDLPQFDRYYTLRKSGLDHATATFQARRPPTPLSTEQIVHGLQSYPQAVPAADLAHAREQSVKEIQAMGLVPLTGRETVSELRDKIKDHYEAAKRAGTGDAYAAVDNHHVLNGVPAVFAEKGVTNQHRAMVASLVANEHRVAPGHHGLPLVKIRDLSQEKSPENNKLAPRAAAIYQGDSHKITFDSHEVAKSSNYTTESRKRAFFSPSKRGVSFLHRTATHEYAHGLHARMNHGGDRETPMFRELTAAIPRTTPLPRNGSFDKWVEQNKAAIINHVGTYASANMHELIAELYSEYRNAISPSKAAQIVGRHLTGGAQ